MVIVDYGHEEAESYRLVALGRHAHQLQVPHDLHRQPAQDPGECDITAHLNLGAVTRAAGATAGWTCSAGSIRRDFMLGLGIDELMTLDQSFEPGALRRRLALKTLMLPGGLGGAHRQSVDLRQECRVAAAQRALVQGSAHVTARSACERPRKTRNRGPKNCHNPPLWQPSWNGRSSSSFRTRIRHGKPSWRPEGSRCEDDASRRIACSIPSTIRCFSAAACFACAWSTARPC